MIRFILGILAGAGMTLMYGASKAQERKEAEKSSPETGEQKEGEKEDKVVDDKETTNPTT